MVVKAEIITNSAQLGAWAELGNKLIYLHGGCLKGLVSGFLSIGYGPLDHSFVEAFLVYKSLTSIMQLNYCT